MTHLRSLIVLVLAVGVDALRSKRDAATDEADVKAAIESFYAAMKKADPKAAMAMIAPDAMFVESGRSRLDSSTKRATSPADIDFEKQITGKRSPWRITVNGDTAWGNRVDRIPGDGRWQRRAFVSRQLAVVTRGEDGNWLIRSIHWSSMRL
jgi:ketosteroid isomerase-like protein